MKRANRSSLVQERGCDVMVACDLPKVDARVRFPPPAPNDRRRRSQVVRQDSAKAPPPVRFWASPPIVLLVAAFVATAHRRAADRGPPTRRRLERASSAGRTRGDSTPSSPPSWPRRPRCAATSRPATRTSSIPTARPTRASTSRPGPWPSGCGPTASRAARPRVAQLRHFHDEWEQGVGLPLRRRPASPDSAGYQAYGKVLTDQMRAQSKTPAAGPDRRGRAGSRPPSSARSTPPWRSASGW